MSLNSFRNNEKIYDDHETEKALMCQARECPNRWSVDKGEKLCTAHAWEPPNRWPIITNMQLNAYARHTEKQQQEPAPKLSNDEKIAILSKLRVLTNTNPRQWAYNLKALEADGYKLNAIQKKMWREALRENI
jgi:hypothetical protein